MINWHYFPKSNKIPDHLYKIVGIFEQHKESIESPHNKLHSNEVLRIISEDLEKLCFKVEKSKKAEDKILIPVLFGRNGKMEKSFDADAYNYDTKTVLEVEAGRAIDNYQFLKDIFQACMMFDTQFLVIAVRNIYNQHDFEKVVTFLDTLYASQRLQLPLTGILVIGY